VKAGSGTLFGQLSALVILSVVASQAISMVLIVSLPPPMPDFYRLTEIEQALRGAPVNYAERRPLRVSISQTMPEGEQMHGLGASRFQDKVASDMNVSPDRVALSSSSGFYPDRRLYRIIRDRIARQGVREEHFLIAPFKVGIRRDDGRWTVIEPEPSFGLNAWQQRSALWFVLSVLATAPVAYLFARRLADPIRRFAEAATRLGHDPTAPPLALSGPVEIRDAVVAFNDMQQRLHRYVEDRTAMVGAIAHDLRTPLTRLRFRIESAPEDQRAKMAADLDQMEAMIGAALMFVRDASRPAERTKLELSSLLESLCDEMAETGHDTQVTSADRVVLDGDPMALRRLFSNLLENAVKFGRQARTRVFRDDANAIVEIEDEGPGIPAEDHEKVFEPFYRQEPSRSRQTGGIGLGLAVVRSIARAHGGDVALINRPGGGLTARVQLPL